MNAVPRVVDLDAVESVTPIRDFISSAFISEIGAMPDH